MDQRVSMIMTGAQDIAKLKAFYEGGLGWKTWGPPTSAMYKVGHSVIVFLPAAYLAAERGEAVSEGSKTSLAVFVDSKAKVDEIFNKNGWARSLHFLMAWLLVTAFLIYGLAGLVTGHVWRDLAPRPSELAPRALGQDILAHLRLPVRRAPGGPPYGVLQKSAYFLVVAVAVPVMILSGMAMSPAIDAAYPLLPTVFGGAQSARSIHFLVLCLLALFLAAHLIMVAVSGFWRQMRAMTWGR